MTKKFNPYRKWLGIPPDQMPPDHYRLLGIGTFESDPDVISNAADRQMAHVRTFQSGKNADLSQQILNELSNARVCLLDVQQKSAYDTQLRQRLAESLPSPSLEGTPSPPPAVSIPATPPPPRSATSQSEPQSTEILPTVQPGRRAMRKTAQRKNTWQVPAMFIGLVFLLIGVFAWALIELTSDQSSETDPNGQLDHPVGVVQNEKLETPRDKPSKPDQVAEKPTNPSIKPKPTPPKKVPEAVLVGDFDEQAADASRSVGEIDRIEGHFGPVWSVAIAPNTISILSGSEDRSVRLWDTQNDTNQPLIGPDEAVLAVDLSLDGRLIATVSGQRSPPSGGTLHLWKVSGGPPILQVDLSHLGYASDVRFSPDCQQVALAGHDNTVRLVPINNGKPTILTGHEGPVTSVAFSPNGDHLLSGSEDGSVCVWDVVMKRRIHHFPGSIIPAVAITSVAYSHDGLWGLSGNQKGTLDILNLETKERFRSIPAHSGSIRSVDFSSEGNFGLSGGDDGVLRFWNLGAGREIHAMKGHDGSVACVRFSPGGRRAVSCGTDTTIRIWKLPDPSTLNFATEKKPDPIGKQAVPDSDQIARAKTKILTETFRDEFAAADRTSLKEALCEKLFEAGKTGDADPRSYTLLNLALKMAIELKKSTLAFEIVDQIDQRFEIDRLTVKTDTLKSLVNVLGNTTASNKTFLAKQALYLSGEAISAERLDDADRLVLKARPLAFGADDRSLTTQVTSRTKEIIRLRKEVEAIRSAQLVLISNPDDPDANEKVGKYICWIRADWAKGLPMLKKASNPELKRLAQADLDNPGEPKQQFDLANGWWNIAETQTDTARNTLLRRAAHWYQSAKPELLGSEKKQAIDRLAKIENNELGTSLVPEVKGFACRIEPTKSALLKAHVVDEACQTALTQALKWLISKQNSDGSWGLDSRIPPVKGAKKNPGSIYEAQNAATALALLPLLGAGKGLRGSDIDPRRVSAGLNFLKSRMVLVRPRTATLFEPNVRSMPSHALGTMALCEATGMGADRQTQIAAVGAVNFIVSSQNDDGGWGLISKLIMPNNPDPSDAETTAWHVAALQTASWADIDVPPDTLKQASLFLDACQVEGESSYMRTPPSASGTATSKPSSHVTASAYLVRNYLGWSSDRTEWDNHFNQILNNGPNKSGDFLLNYKWTYAMRHQNGDSWRQWNPAINTYLLQNQETVGKDIGSWYIPPPSKGQPNQGGRLGTTCLASLILEAAYRFPPLTKTRKE